MKQASQREKDLSVPCPHKRCLAKVGQSCIQNNGSRLMAKGKEVVHFGRRVKSFLKPSKE